jgi:tetrahydromethanopterin S-methyltransferase subunit E
MCVLDYEEHRLCARKGQNLTGQCFDCEVFLPSCSRSKVGEHPSAGSAASATISG